MKIIVAAMCLSVLLTAHAQSRVEREVLAQNHNSPAYQRLIREVRHELIMLPYLGVFDNLGFTVNGGTVTLTGQVTRPTLKSDAENVVKKIEGVEKVVNHIEVLPLSPNDDRIRREVYFALARQPQLQRYFMQAVSPIRIIVKNGNVDLQGIVANKADADFAKITANGVPGVFSVTNSLRTER